MLLEVHDKFAELRRETQGVADTIFTREKGGNKKTARNLRAVLK